MAKIESHQYSIEEAFRNCFYVVPDYQREYVWTEKEVLQLLNDIGEQIDGSSTNEYFIGTILVTPREEKNHFDVIDGQQRLTTFFLLLCALRHLFKGDAQYQTLSGLISTSYLSSEGENRTNLKLEPRYENAGELMTRMVELEDDPHNTRAAIEESDIKTFGSLENLLSAYSTLYKHLQDNYKDKGELKKYMGYLVNKVIFIQISTDVGSALKIFETINERGIGLNPMDLLKNLLFTQVKTAEFSRLKDEWKKVTAPLEQAEEKPLRFLRYFLMANYPINNARNDSVVREDEIYGWLTNKDNVKLCGYKEKPFEFVRRITRSVEHYLAFLEGRGNDNKKNVEMENLRRLTGGAFSLHFVLLLAASSLPKALFDEFVIRLESFLFYYIFTKTPTKDLERNFSVWADELRKIVTLTSEEAQQKALNRFVQDKFKKNMSGKEQELTDALKRLSIGGMQQYRLRYLLAKLTQHVDMAYKGLQKAGSLDGYVDLEIEHILPDKPKPELRSKFAEVNPKADYDEYKIKLGNLTLLEKPINIVASNDFYDKKQDEYAKCKYYLTSSLAGLNSVGKNSSINRINKKLKSYQNWGAKTIDDRQDRLIELAKDVWSVEEIEVV